MRPKSIPTYKFTQFWRLCAYFLTVLICYFSLAPSPPQPDLDIPAIDKFYHFIFYSALSLSYLISHPQRWHYKIIPSLILMGVLIEYLQAYTGYRQFEYYDMLANSLGVGLGYLALYTNIPQFLAGQEQFWQQFVKRK